MITQTITHTNYSNQTSKVENQLTKVSKNRISVKMLETTQMNLTKNKKKIL